MAPGSIAGSARPDLHAAYRRVALSSRAQPEWCARGVDRLKLTEFAALCFQQIKVMHLSPRAAMILPSAPAARSIQFLCMALRT
jgi:hypothetical protein